MYKLLKNNHVIVALYEICFLYSIICLILIRVSHSASDVYLFTYLFSVSTLKKILSIKWKFVSLPLSLAIV